MNREDGKHNPKNAQGIDAPGIPISSIPAIAFPQEKFPLIDDFQLRLANDLDQFADFYALQRGMDISQLKVSSRSTNFQ